MVNIDADKLRKKVMALRRWQKTLREFTRVLIIKEAKLNRREAILARRELELRQRELEKAPHETLAIFMQKAYFQDAVVKIKKSSKFNFFMVIFTAATYRDDQEVKTTMIRDRIKLLFGVEVDLNIINHNIRRFDAKSPGKFIKRSIYYGTDYPNSKLVYFIMKEGRADLISRLRPLGIQDPNLIAVLKVGVLD